MDNAIKEKKTITESKLNFVSERDYVHDMKS